MMSADEIWDPSPLPMVNFPNYDWVDHFGSQEGTFNEILEEEMSDWNPDSLSNGEVFKWTNYFDNDSDPSATPAFQDLLTQTFKWKDYFNPDEINFPEVDAFPSKTDWIQWDDLAVESLEWNTLPELPQWLPVGNQFPSDISIDKGSQLYEKIESRIQSDSLRGSNDLNTQLEDSSQQNSKNNSAVSSNLQDRPTFLTAKRCEWQTQVYTAQAVIKFRKNIHDTRDTRSAGSDPTHLNPPEIIEPHCSSSSEPSNSNSPELLTTHTDDYHYEGESSRNDLASLPKIQESDDNTLSSNVTSPAFTPDMPLTILSLPKLSDPNKMINQYRPHSSQGLYFQEPSPVSHHSLLQVPSTYCEGRRTSEPCLPKLPPPRRLKTPLGLIDDSKFWAVKKKREPWDQFEKPTLAKGQLKKLKKPISRCRSAMDKPTCFDIDELGSQAQLIQTSPKLSLKGLTKEFRFRKNNCRVSPEPHNMPSNVGSTRKGIKSKVKSIKPKNCSRKAKMFLFKRRELIPVIRNLLKGSILRIDTSAKVEPTNTPQNLAPYGSPRQHSPNNFMNSNNNPGASPSQQYNVIKYKPFIHGHYDKNGNGGGQTKTSLTRRRPYWVRFLRCCNIRQRFGIHRSKKNLQQGHRVCKINK